MVECFLQICEDVDSNPQGYDTVCPDKTPDTVKLFHWNLANNPFEGSSLDSYKAILILSKTTLIHIIILKYLA